MNLLWVLLIVAFPVMAAAYFGLLSVVGGRLLGYEYREEHNQWLYAAFVGGLAAVVLHAFPRTLAFGFEPYYLLFLIVGAGMYRLDMAMLAHWLDRRIRSGRQRLPWMLPVVAIAPAEEVLFRGVLTTVLAKYGAVAYVASSSVLFGISHYREGHREVAFKTVNGAMYCLLYLVTGSLLSPLLAHLGYNVASVHRITGGIGSEQ